MPQKTPRPPVSPPVFSSREGEEAAGTAVNLAIEQIPELKKILGSVRCVSPLNGLTNRVYRVATPDGDFALRLPRPENTGLIDREAEAHNLVLACEHGLAPPILLLDPRSGVLLTRVIGQEEPSRRVKAATLGQLVARLHSARLPFRGTIDPDGLIARQGINPGGRADLLSAFAPLADILTRLGPVADTFDPVPSHGDLSPGNVLAGTGGPILIDWEYSAMASPAWDLAYAILEHDLDADAERTFLEAYEESTNAVADLRREVLKMKIRCDAVSMLWALDQAMKGNGSTDFDAFARTRLERAFRAASELSG